MSAWHSHFRNFFFYDATEYIITVQSFKKNSAFYTFGYRCKSNVLKFIEVFIIVRDKAVENIYILQGLANAKLSPFFNTFNFLIYICKQINA